MRRDAMEADVVIVNHHLFFADLALRGGDYGSVLPDYNTVIFDEAHELEDVAASYFGTSVSSYRIADLIQDANKLEIKEAEQQSELVKALARLSQRSDTFWLSFRGTDLAEDSDGDESGNTGWRGSRSSYRRRGGAGSADGRYPLSNTRFVRADRDGNLTSTATGEAYVVLVKAIDRLITTLGVVKDPPAELDNIVRRAQSLKFDLEFIVSGDQPDFVYWLEFRGRGVFINATPIDVSGILDENLFTKVQTAVLTSATMTAGASFDFLRGRLGIRHARELIVESHFDFQKQAVLYLPQRMPDPRSREFLDASVEEIIRIINATHGRAFVLFTSVSAMRETYEQVKDFIDYPSFIQGQGSKTGLLERFRKTKGAVLFATASF